MKDSLQLGTLAKDGPFNLPIDAVLHTFAFIGIRGAGKTVAATVLAEEMSEAGLPWIAFDPIGVWWGLRADPDGTAGGYPVVIIGGQHADLPLDRDGGAKAADAILHEDIACVLDLSRESKNVWRKFVADFCDRMMEINPTNPRHVFIEEAPEFIPQRPMGEQKRSLAAVDRLARLGRNNGYGLSLISQRYATVQKDVLTQCESLFAGRMIGKPDRDTCHDWMIEAAGVSEKEAKYFLDSLPSLGGGRFWFWSPQWMGQFSQIQIRKRRTYHPGATRTMGQAPKQVALSDVRDFVSRFERVLTAAPASPAKGKEKNVTESEAAKLRKENHDLKGANEDLLRRIEKLERVDRANADTARQPSAQRAGTDAAAAEGDRAASSRNRPSRPFSVEESLDNEALYRAIKARLIEEAETDPRILQVLTVRPEIEVKVERQIVHADGNTLLGRVALLITEGFFNKPATGSAAFSELSRRGFRTSKPNVYKEADKLAAMGFLTKERDAGYQAVSGMKVNIVES